MTIYQDLGGDTGIRTAVDDFYRRVLADPELAPYFSDTDMETLQIHMTSMLGAATGGPSPYTGKEMGDAHRGLNITSEHFDLVVGHLVGTLTDLGVDGATIGQIGAALLPLKPEIVQA